MRSLRFAANRSVAAAVGESEQRDGGRKLPVRVIKVDNPYGSLGIRPLPCCTGGVQEFEFWQAASRWVVSKLKQGEITPLQDVKRKHLELRAGSGFGAENPIDVGVRGGAKNSPGLEKVPQMAGDVPVRDAPDSGGSEAGAAPGDSRTGTQRLTRLMQGGAMKTTGHGIDDSKDVANVYHLRLMTLLQELVRDKGYHGAARVLEIDQQTVTESARTGQLTRRVRQSLERALQEGVGSAAARQRERNDRLEERLQWLEQDHEALGREARRRLAAVEGQVGGLHGNGGEAAGQPGAGAGQGNDGPSQAVTSEGNKTLPSRPPPRREYPDLATLELASDDEEVFGDAWPLIVEWRKLKDSHPTKGRGLAWRKDQQRLLEVELALLEEHGLTLLPERRPLRGFRPQRADKLAPDGVGRHPEGAGQAGILAQGPALAHPGAVAEIGALRAADGIRKFLCSFCVSSYELD